ncbi:MAG: hypothetical protein QOF76_3944 [Solirubrobacteraceae bacterium]|jgi:mannose-6-phosphate isomerase-like protein (cupin superfamily)|nr:hypothetical protein [Solirubrobacteraceae bacterium]
MSNFTHTHLKDVKDSAPDFGLEGVEARFATGDLSASDTGVAYQRLDANQRSGFGHKHENAEEVYVVLSGSGQMKLDDDIIDIGPLDAIRVAPPVVRAFAAGDEGLELIAFGPRHEGDGEMVQDWWPA